MDRKHGAGRGTPSVHIIYILLCALLLQLFCVARAETDASAAIPFAGSGTKDDPYLIEDEADLMAFRDLVDEGESFKGRWLLQMKDMDLQSKEWKPIGVYGSGCYFEGVYNGGGHRIRNLLISEQYAEENNSGFFGVLGGIVLNLGIESGYINGGCVGSIASHSLQGTQPYIINCYSRASLRGSRVGGIVDNFGGGFVIHCWYDDSVGLLEGMETGTISSYAGTLLDCYDTVNSRGGSLYARTWDDAKSKEGDAAWDDRWLTHACSAGVDLDMLFPAVWNGASLEFAEKPFEKPDPPFEGQGTRQSPYLIHDYHDLALFRRLVNGGESFENKYFRQTADIVMEEDDWTPIGLYGSGRSFRGIYDGDGCCIDGLTCLNHGAGWMDCAGLFGQLGGVVANLIVTNASVNGECCGIIASGSSGYERTMAIINCYVQGEVRANRPAGIVDNFDKGLIAGCCSDVVLSFILQDAWSQEELEYFKSTGMGGITANSVDTKVYACFTTADQVMPEAYRTATSSTLLPEDLESKAFLNKQNLRIALIQQLFGNQYGVDLIEWASLKKGRVRLEGNQLIKTVAWLNEYSPALLADVLMLILAGVLAFGRKERRTAGTPAAIAVITGAIALFVDCAALGSARGALTDGRLTFIVEINTIFVAALAVALKRSMAGFRAPSVNWWLVTAMVGVLVAELLQFDTVPRYDASLYYGSLARGCGLYRLDLLTYIGAFVCWKWAQGTALLVAPWEFLLPGRMIGVYIGNIIITEITLVVFYKLIREMIPRISRAAAVFSSLILVLCPFQLGMFTYLCFDSHCVYYAVWLIYSYRRRNNLMVSFCGFLLFFTKISGGAFYVVFLITAAMVEVLTEQKGLLHRRIAGWWKWSKCILWVLPAIAYALVLRWGEWLTIQHFNGANLVESIAAKEFVSLANTLVQSFVFGFRWLFVLIIALTVIVYLYRPMRKGKILSRGSVKLVVATATAGIAVLIVLLLYNSDAECPRYTALLNVAYALLVPVCLCRLFRRRGVRTCVTGLLAALLLAQTYWSIDPSVTQLTSGLDTGTNVLYKLALDGDSRPGMNLGMNYGPGYSSVGDIYAYNVEYNFYNGLINEAMCRIEPSKSDTFYVLDVIDYELHLRGNQYFIYWNTADRRFTYNGAEENTILLNQRSATTAEITGVAASHSLGRDFYLVVPARVAYDEAMNALTAAGYRVTDEYHPANRYGTMSFYHLEVDA